MHRSGRSRRQRARDTTTATRRISLNPLLEPIEKQQVEEVMAMIKAGEKKIPSEQLDEALLKAAGYGQAVVCELLASGGAAVNNHEERDAFVERLESTPCFTPAQSLQHAWLQHHSSVGGAPLHRAAEGGHAATVGALLTAGARVNEADENGVTPLMLACMRRGNHEVVRHLVLTAGCHVSTKEKRVGRTAVHFAAHVGDKTTLMLLLDQGGEVDTRDNLQNTPLMLATTPLRYEEPTWPPADVSGCIQLLIARGAFVNLVNKDSESALQRALEIEDGSAVEILLTHNAVSHPNILRDAALTYREVAAVEKLLALGGAFSGADIDLIAVLVCLICEDSSPWTLNAKRDERTTHEIARHLIAHVHEWEAPVERMMTLGDKDLEALFGEEHVLAFASRYRTDIVQFGLFGAALKHGKYSVARMLHIAGSDLEAMRVLKESSLADYLMSQEWLAPWLRDALEGTAVANDNDGKEAAAAAADKRRLKLADVEPFDMLVRENEDALMNQFYSGREESQAARQQLLWMYQ